MAEALETQEQFSVRLPWMAEILETQEQFSVRPPWIAEMLKTQERFPVKRESRCRGVSASGNIWGPAFAGTTQLAWALR